MDKYMCDSKMKILSRDCLP